LKFYGSEDPCYGLLGYDLMVSCQHFGKPCCFCVQGSGKTEAVWSSVMLVFYQITAWCHNPDDHNMNLHCCKISSLAAKQKFLVFSVFKYNFMN